MLAAVALATPPAAAQERATLRGTVVDSRGTALPRVTVVVRGRESGAERPAVTAPDGTFMMGGLAPGLYDVVVEDPAFAAFRREVALAPGAEQTIRIELAYTVADFVPVPDRWRLRFPDWQRYPPGQGGDYPFVRNRGFDPYDQNVLKGDLPLAGDSLFLIFTGVVESPLEYRLLPTPAGVSTERPDSEAFFGENEQYALLPSAIASFELFHGSTSFRPRDWAIRVTPQFNVNYVSTRERGGLNVSPEEPATRRRDYLAVLQEAFGEVKLFDVGEYYDFTSVRAGIQPFNSDFRGFLFRDTNLGVRAFGNWGRNRNQWNVAVFDQLEKETNSDLNLLVYPEEEGGGFARRRQRVFIANYYRQDFLAEGYTFSVSAHANQDRPDRVFYDANGFLVRPSPVGLIQPHNVDAYYVGAGGDGHWGRLNVTHQFYAAFGTDAFNGVSGTPVDIEAQFAAVEISVDRNWYRPKAAFLFASGDDDPDDTRARGFDAIVDNPNIAGGPFSFWNRYSIRLAQTGLGLVGRNSVLPSLRSSKAEGQASFVNPGLLLFNGGLDAELTRKLRMTVNVNYLRFHRTETLQRLLFQADIDPSIGIDGSVGFQYRPALNDNLVITSGVSLFMPRTGFQQILTDRMLYSPFAVVTITY